MKFNATASFVTLAISGRPQWDKVGNPRCHLCKDKLMPGNPFGAAAIMLPAATESKIFTCQQLYNMGLQGKITPQMCNPIRYFMAQICECREYKKPRHFWIVNNNN